MPIQLRVTHTTNDTVQPVDYRFDDDRILLGRGADAHVHLADETRVISKRHAEVRRAGAHYQLVDLGSKNFTYLGGRAIDAEQPYPLKDGDTFQIGDYAIAVAVVTPTIPPDTHETVFAADFRNPFEAPVQQLVEAVNAVALAYEREAPSRRDDALHDACDAERSNVGDHPAVARALALLGTVHDAPPSHASPSHAPTSPTEADTAERPPPDFEEATWDTPLAPTQYIPDPDELPQEAASTSKPWEPASDGDPASRDPASPEAKSHVDDPASDDVVDALFRAVARLITIPWQFRHEFIGQTIMQAPDAAFLYTGDPAELRRQLLDPTASEAVRRKRLAMLAEATEAVAVHQVALLDGYKAATTHGTERLLHSLDPDAVESELVHERPMLGWMPWAASDAVVDRIAERREELKHGEWSVAERMIFRPAFIKAYLTRMTAAEGDSLVWPDSAVEQTPPPFPFDAPSESAGDSTPSARRESADPPTPDAPPSSSSSSSRGETKLEAAPWTPREPGWSISSGSSSREAASKRAAHATPSEPTASESSSKPTSSEPTSSKPTPPEPTPSSQEAVPRPAPSSPAFHTPNEPPPWVPVDSFGASDDASDVEDSPGAPIPPSSGASRSDASSSPEPPRDDASSNDASSNDGASDDGGRDASDPPWKPKW